MNPLDRHWKKIKKLKNHIPQWVSKSIFERITGCSTSTRHQSLEKGNAQKKSFPWKTLNLFHLTVSNQLRQVRLLAPGTLLLCCIKSHSHGFQPVVSAGNSFGWRNQVSDGSDSVLLPPAYCIINLGRPVWLSLYSWIVLHLCNSVLYT